MADYVVTIADHANDDGSHTVVDMKPLTRCRNCIKRFEINCPQYYRRTELPDDYYCSDGEQRSLAN